MQQLNGDKPNHLNQIVRKGLDALKSIYDQVTILGKLETLGYSVGEASLSKIKKGNPVGIQTLKAAATGIQQLIRTELDMGFDEASLDFVPQNTKGWVSAPVANARALRVAEQPLVIHPLGRLELPQKTEFMLGAQLEIIEVGVRLNTFTSYFFHQKEAAFKQHIIEILKKGVHYKGYLLDPESHEASMYFDDRGKVMSAERDAIDEMRKVVKRLQWIKEELDAMQLKGQFDIFLYKHIPCAMFLMVDGSNAEQAKMMVSPYLYGIKRADCPVLEFTRKQQPKLFRTYQESLRLITKEAKALPKTSA